MDRYSMMWGKFKDFMEPMTFANKVAEVAEKAAYHPDLKIDWEECAIEIWADLPYEILEKFLMVFRIELFHAITISFTSTGVKWTSSLLKYPPYIREQFTPLLDDK